MVNNKTTTENLDKKDKKQDESFCKIPPIHVMPEVFLSAASQHISLKKKKKLKKIEKKKGVTPQQKKEDVSTQKKERLIHPAVLILGVVLLIGLGSVIVYLVFVSPEESPEFVEPIVVEQPSVVKPPIRPPVKPSISLDPTNVFYYQTTVDSDSDGLTDKEEQLYGTGVNNKDEDQDLFVDGLEVISLYSPKAKDNSKLADSDMVYIFNNQEQGYSIFHPRKWTVQPLKDDNSDVSFASDTGEFVEVLVLKNSRKENILQWAKRQYPNISAGSLDKIGVGDALGIKSPNGLTVTFADDDNIYSVIYQIGTLRKLNFKTTFQMMYNSLKLYSRTGESAVVAEEWQIYKNKTVGMQIQYPSNLNPVAKDGVINIDDFSLSFIDNVEKLTIQSWFEKNYFNKDENRDCRFKASDFNIGKMPTFLIDKTGNGTAREVCADVGYYSISLDNSRIVKLSLGTNPVREMAQILSTLVLLEREEISSVSEDVETDELMGRSPEELIN